MNDETINHENHEKLQKKSMWWKIMQQKLIDKIVKI